MTETNAYLNQLWADHFVDQLTQLGVTNFALSPGSRNTPLIRAVAKNDACEKIMHFDERGSAFFALGCSKATKKPSCIIVTSGSATGNLLPAIMEAFASDIPLIIVTSDRPDELHHCGSNQTISQTCMFQKYTSWSVNVAAPTPSISISYIKSLCSQAVIKSQKGPVHINMQFREPFFYKEHSLLEDVCPATHIFYPYQDLVEKELLNILEDIKKHHQGLIIAGYDSFSPSQATILDDFAKALNFPVFADVLSGARFSSNENNIKHYSLLCNLEIIQTSLKPSCVIHFGKQYVSKHLLLWLNKLKPEKVYHIHDKEDTQDPFHFVTDKIIISPHRFCSNMLKLIKHKTTEHYLSSWKNFSYQSSLIIKNALSEYSSLNEAYFFNVLSSNHCLKNTSLYISNSMPIRNADAYFFPSYFLSCFGSRGVSGIDGNIATILGLAKATKKKTLAVLGDLATLHDLNSLALMHQVTTPVILFVINNQGGSIFSFLPVSEDKTHFNQYFATKHSYDFKAACQMFNIDYHRITSKSDLQTTLSTLSSLSKHLFVEIEAKLSDNLNIHQFMTSQLNHHLSSCYA